MNVFQEHIAITEENLQTWLLRSDSTGYTLSQEDQSMVNDALKIKSGDDVWLARRTRLPKVSLTDSIAANHSEITPITRADPHSSERYASAWLNLLNFEVGLILPCHNFLSEHYAIPGEYTPTKDPHFLWITEFPLFTRNDADKDFLAKGRWSSSHHPFTAPMWEDIPALYQGDTETVCAMNFDHIRDPFNYLYPLQVRGQHYDLVLNGVEIGGGSVRIHDPLMQDHVFTNILQVGKFTLCRRLTLV